MKIYVNSLHQIMGIRKRPEWDTESTLKEIKVEDDFLQGYCDTVKCAFCYHEWTDEEGRRCLSVYPYKDWAVMESIQQEYDLREAQMNAAIENWLDTDLRVTMLEIGSL